MNDEITIKEIQRIAKGLYQLNISSNINKLIDLIEMSTLFKGKEHSEMLKLINNFLSNKDYILLADFLIYEFIPTIYKGDKP